MSIRLKIILVVLPLLVATLLLSGIASSFSARRGITRLAVEFLSFKAQQLDNYLASQWDLLSVNDLQEEQYIRSARQAAASYTRTLIASPSELIFALTADGRIGMATAAMALSDSERRHLLTLAENTRQGWVELSVAGVQRVGYLFAFAPFGWSCFVTEERSAFYSGVTEILTRNGIILAAACGVSLALLLAFSGYLTRPITRMVAAMHRIIGTGDLSERVKVEYRDEIGELAHTFNLTVGELETAYNRIKSFAFNAVLARKHEQEIRNIFQKYVPSDVIDRFFKNPESMLKGEDRVLAVMFSDIRSFTTISEGMKPDELVGALNAYFSIMVDIVMKHGGIVDKYIGDAIMAFFGAPVQHEDDAARAVRCALDMQEALRGFNREQAGSGRPEFRIGIGINYGPVTVGNIGSELKMDYTVIGDMVNLASRLESLTKVYRTGLLFSESVHAQVKGRLPCRLVDRVLVRGKTKVEHIYTARRSVAEREKKAWLYHHSGLKRYFKGSFAEAERYFQAALKLSPEDYTSILFHERCQVYRRNPPPQDWNGVQVMAEK